MTYFCNFGFSPVQITKLTQIYVSSELSSVVFEATVPRPLSENAQEVQLIIDVDPKSCNNLNYSKKIIYQLPVKRSKIENRRPKMQKAYFVFSDSSLPKDCEIYLYLQKSCLANIDDCNTQISGIPSYSHS